MKIFKYLKTIIFFSSILISIPLSAERNEFSIQKKLIVAEPITIQKIAHSGKREWERKPNKESECPKSSNTYEFLSLNLEKIYIKSYSVNNFVSRRKNQASLCSFPLLIQFSKKLSGYYSSEFPAISVKNYSHIVTDNQKDYHKRYIITTDELIDYETKKNIPEIHFQLNNQTYDFKLNLKKLNFALMGIPPVKQHPTSPKFSSTILPKFTFSILEPTISPRFSYNRPKTLADNDLRNKKFLSTSDQIKKKLNYDLAKLGNDTKSSIEIVKLCLNLEEKDCILEKNSSALTRSKTLDINDLKKIATNSSLLVPNSTYLTKNIGAEACNLDLANSRIDLQLKKNRINANKPALLSNLAKLENIELIEKEMCAVKSITTPFQVKRSNELTFYKDSINIPKLAVFNIRDANNPLVENNNVLRLKPAIASLGIKKSYINTSYAKSFFSLTHSNITLFENRNSIQNQKPSFQFVTLLKIPDTNTFHSYIDCKKINKLQNPTHQLVVRKLEKEIPINILKIGLQQKTDFIPKYTLFKENQICKDENNSPSKKGFLERVWSRAQNETSINHIDLHRSRETKFKIKSKGYQLKDLDHSIPEKKIFVRNFIKIEKNIFFSKVSTLAKPKKYKAFIANEEINSLNFQVQNKKLDIKINKLSKSKYDYLKPYKTNLTLYAIEAIDTPPKSALLAPSKLLVLDELINLLPKNVIDGKRGFIKSFFIQEAISVAYKQVYEKEKLDIEFIANTELELPKKIDYFIHISHDSKSKNPIYSGAIARIKPLITSKEYLLPKKSYIQSPKVPNSTLIYTFDTQKNETLYLCTPLEDLESLSIPRSFKWNLDTNLISKDYIKASFLPCIKYENYFVNLFESEPFTTKDSLISECKSINKMNRYTQKNLSEIPSLDDLNTFNLSSEFKLDGFQIPKMDGSGYAFELNLSSYNSNILDPVDGKIYFIIDRGNGIENHRFQSFKSAIVQALNYVPENSTFNIFAFDNEAIKLSDRDLKATKSSIKYVNKTLEKLGQKWSSSFMGFISAVEKIQKEAAKSSTPTRIILLSNGQFMKNIRFNREALCKVFKDLSSNVSISTVAISDNNNLQMLELISKLGKGEFLHSQTHAAFPRKLSVLTRRIQNPLMTDIRVHILNSDSKAEVTSNSSLAPFVYGDKVFSIHGQTKKLQPIHVMIQGKSGEKWIQVSKKIDLSEAERSKSVDKDLSEKEALEHIMNFIFTNDQKELLKARELTRPFDIKWL
jgi:hypothetical protein